MSGAWIGGIATIVGTVVAAFVTAIIKRTADARNAREAQRLQDEKDREAAHRLELEGQRDAQRHGLEVQAADLQRVRDVNTEMTDDIKRLREEADRWRARAEKAESDGFECRQREVALMLENAKLRGDKK